MPRALSEDRIQSFREELCGVAAELFASHGFEGVTLRSIAAALGVSPMTPYRYFANKEEIFHAVRMRGFQRFAERIEAVADAYADPVTRLRAISHAYVRFGLDEPHTYRTLFQLDPPKRELEPHEEAIVQSVWAPLRATLDELASAGLLRGDVHCLAHLCWIQAHGLVTLHLAEKLRFGLSLHELIDPMLDVYLAGVRPR